MLNTTNIVVGIVSGLAGVLGVGIGLWRGKAKSIAELVKLESRVDTIEKKDLARIDQRLTGLSERIDNLDEKVTEKIDKVGANVQDLSERSARFEGRIEALVSAIAKKFDVG